MAAASQSDFTLNSAARDKEMETNEETTENMNGNINSDNIINDEYDLKAKEMVKREEKSVSLESGQHEISSSNVEQQQHEGEKELLSNQELNGNVSDEAQEDKTHEEVNKSENINSEATNDKIFDDDSQRDNGAVGDEDHKSTSPSQDVETPSEPNENHTPPISLSRHRRSPTGGSPDRGHHSGGDRGHHSGGCHKFPDEESRAEYMKIKSEVTGEAETSESEDEEEPIPVEHTHSGSHTSPDSKTKAEYRKIKYEVTGEALTSESEEENGEGEVQPEAVDEAKKEKEEWLDIFGNGLLKRRIQRAGKGRDTRPERGQIVMMRTAGRLEDGTPVDWNQCLEFILGEGDVIQAWDVGVALIELSEVCELVTDARYAYGERGRDGDNPIPPNAKITYEIELLAVRDGPDMETMSDEERIKIGDKKRELGNDLFTRGDYSGAINCYQRAIKYLIPSSNEKVQELKVKCWNNLAAAQLKIKAHPAALTSCIQVLNIDPENVKALFRKGKVLAAQGDLQQAVKYVKQANQNEPGNKTIRTELTNLRRQLTSQTQKERNMYERMVGGISEKEKTSSKHSIFPWSLVFGATVVVFGGIVAALYLSKH